MHDDYDEADAIAEFRERLLARDVAWEVPAQPLPSEGVNPNLDDDNTDSADE